MRDRPYFVYIMANRRKGTLYVGVTNDLLRRAHEHREGLVPGFTSKYGVRLLVYCEPHDDITVAIAREKQVKRWRREWKFALIERANPEWIDLWASLSA
jgi:putative endonuclease